MRSSKKRSIRILSHRCWFFLTEMHFLSWNQASFESDKSSNCFTSYVVCWHVIFREQVCCRYNNLLRRGHPSRSLSCVTRQHAQRLESHEDIVTSPSHWYWYGQTTRCHTTTGPISVGGHAPRFNHEDCSLLPRRMLKRHMIRSVFNKLRNPVLLYWLKQLSGTTQNRYQR